jgi:hypothetical protein
MEEPATATVLICLMFLQGRNPSNITTGTMTNNERKSILLFQYLKTQ